MEEKGRIDKWCQRVADRICQDREERVIVQYGLSRIFWMLLTLSLLVITGCLWGQFLFAMLIFLQIYFLRPYAGGYHADTEIRCLLLSAGIVNIAMLLRRTDVLPLPLLLILALCSFLLILFLAPVGNPINPLSEEECRVYGKKARALAFVYLCLLGATVTLRLPLFRDSLLYSFIIVGLGLLAGKKKYGREADWI